MWDDLVLCCWATCFLPLDFFFFRLFFLSFYTVCVCLCVCTRVHVWGMSQREAVVTVRQNDDGKPRPKSPHSLKPDLRWHAVRPQLLRPHMQLAAAAALKTPIRDQRPRFNPTCSTLQTPAPCQNFTHIRSFFQTLPNLRNLSCFYWIG